MKLQSHIFSFSRSVGFTLIEMVVSITVGLVVIGAVVSLSITSAQNFAATANYVDMDSQSRNALDRISREIRNATALAAFSTNNPQFLRLTNANNGSGATITYDATPGTLTLAKTGEPVQTILTGCDSFSFQLFNRYPSINTSTNLSFLKSTNAVTGQVDNQFCKVINMSWKCSRTIRGSKLNTEVVQTAQVMLRNQVSQ
jgi:Tfp pilus assembly protein PilW